MKALVLEENKKLNYQDVEMPQRIDDTYILVKIAAVGICGSDLGRGFEGGAYHYPLIMGHEMSGIIAEDKSDSIYSKGDKVAIFPLIPCKKCKACQTGDYAQCSDYNYFGSRCDGGMAEYIMVPEENLFKVPDHVNILNASMTEPCAVALHGVRKLDIKAGNTGVVFGGGPIGNMTAQWLKISGCSEVFLVDIDEEKLKLAADMGLTPINSMKVDAVEELIRLTHGEGVDKVVEACGLPITFLQALRCTARFGEVVFMGNIHGTFEVGEKDFSNILRLEIKIHGTWNSKVTPRGSDDWTTVLKYMDKELQVSPLISDRPKLEEGAEIFNAMINKERSFNKVIFDLQ